MRCHNGDDGSVDKSVGRGTPQTVVIDPFDKFNYESSSVGLDRFKSLRLTQRETHTMCFDQKKERNLLYYSLRDLYIGL